jgi:hypothetical protein
MDINPFLEYQASTQLIRTELARDTYLPALQQRSGKTVVIRIKIGIE